MVKIKERITDCKDTNLVFLMLKESDINFLSDLKLSASYLREIKKTIKDKKSFVLELSIYNGNINKLFILYYDKSDKNELEYFLGNEIRKLPNKLAFLGISEKNVISLLNCAILGRYKFQEYKSDKKYDEIIFIGNIEIKNIVKNRLKTIENIIMARDLGEIPANVLTPENFAKIVKNEKWKKSKVKVFDYKKIKDIGLNLISAVGESSDFKPCVVIIERIIDKKYPTIGIVGKGITFDSGGIQLKPENCIYEMKSDMSGAGNAYALMKDLDERDLKVNVVTCLVLAENIVGACSYRPSDIIKSYSGKTVNIVHTDAEGRLILADGISYLSENYKLDKIITIATLTGACMRALGYRYGGIMGNDEDFIKKCLDYSKNHLEKYWRLPFDNYFIEKTKGDIADLDNLHLKMNAGASMGAAFLYNFVLNNEKFTHIDIGSSGINNYEPYGYINLGATGFGVDSLSSIIGQI